jgi:hypothetical protein
MHAGDEADMPCISPFYGRAIDRPPLGGPGWMLVLVCFGLLWSATGLTIGEVTASGAGGRYAFIL